MPLFYFSLLFYINGNILETQVLTSADLFPSLCTLKVGEVESYSASTTSSITDQQNMVPNTIKSFKIQNRAALFTNCHLPGFLLQRCETACLPLGQHMTSLVWYMTQDYRDPAFSQDHSKGSGGVSQRMWEKCWTNIPWPKQTVLKTGAAEHEPLSQGPGISSMLKRKTWSVGGREESGIQCTRVGAQDKRASGTKLHSLVMIAWRHRSSRKMLVNLRLR